jgi:hypothetical protein
MLSAVLDCGEKRRVSMIAVGIHCHNVYVMETEIGLRQIPCLTGPAPFV